MKYRPEVAPWQFRSHRLRRLHRKLCHVDGKVAFVGGINIIDDMNTPGQQAAARSISRCASRARCSCRSCRRCSGVWALVELVQFERSEVPLFPDAVDVRSARARRPRSS